MAGADSADNPPKAYLFLQDGERYFRFFFTKPRVLLGRAEDNDIVIRDEAILPRHAEVFLAGPEYQLVAVAGSYTELNDEKVEGVKTLRNGDEIRLGPIHLLYAEEHRTSETALNLIIQREGDIPFGVTINKPMVRVGRRHGDVLIDDDKISDTHLLIENFCEHGVFALDMRSERGTLLNGQPLDARRRIDDGDTIDIGTTHILVRIRRAGEARARRPATQPGPERTVPAGGGSERAPGAAPERISSRLPERPPERVPERPTAGVSRPVVPAPPLPASRPEPSFAIHAPDAPLAEPLATGRARLRRSPDAAPEPAPVDRATRASDRPVRVPERSEPEPSVVAEASDGRVRNTLRMPLSPGDLVPAAPWQGRSESHHPAQSVVSIDGPVRSSPEPLQRPPRRASAPAPSERPPQRQSSRESMAEPQQRVSRADDAHYHYLPGGAARDAGSDPSPRRRERPEGDGPTQRENIPDPAPPRRREDRGANQAFKEGMTIAFPNADAAMVDDGTDEDGTGRYYHPGSSRRR